MHDFVMGDKVLGDKVMGDKVMGDKVMGNKVSGPADQPMDRSRPARSEHRPVILMMSANPDQNSPLRLDEEHRLIDEAFDRAQTDSRLEFKLAPALRIDDLPHCLLRYRPAIAHFSGHGTAADGLAFIDPSGYAHLVPPDAVADLFGVLKAGLRCVVLNACYSAEQARMIAKHVPFVVGMRNWIDDTAAILFSAGFYEGIAFGRTVRESFDLGRVRLSMHGYADDAPILIAAEGAADEPIVQRS